MNVIDYVELKSGEKKEIIYTGCCSHTIIERYDLKELFENPLLYYFRYDAATTKTILAWSDKNWIDYVKKMRYNDFDHICTLKTKAIKYFKSKKKFT